MASVDALLREGITAAKEKRISESRDILNQVIEIDPRNEKAWLWLSEVLESDEQKITCLENVLAINPDNFAAQQGLAFLKHKSARIKPLESRAPIGSSAVTITESKRISSTIPRSTGITAPALTPNGTTTIVTKRVTEKSQTNTCGVLLGVGFVGMVGMSLIVLLLLFSMWASPSGNSSSSGTVGNQTVLQVPGGASALIAVDQQSFDALNKVVATNDKYGLTNLMAENKVFLVSSGTKILVIDRSLFTTRVRILEGPRAGQSGWVPSEWVR